MSAINMVLLGLLINRQISAYDLAKYVETHDLQDIVRFSIPAIYKNLKKLEKQGYLLARSIKQGEMPEKTIYSIADTGKSYFYELMEKYTAQKIKYHFDFNSVVFNLDKLPREKSIELALRLKAQIQGGRQHIIKDLQHWQAISGIGNAVFKQVEMVNAALLQWIDVLLDQLKK